MSAPQPENLPKAEQRRRAILEATLQVIAEGGIDAVTHRRVAAAAGVPLGSTTYYFATRDVLIRETFRNYVATADSTIAALHSAHNDDTIAGIAATMVALARHEAASASVVRAEYELILHAGRDPELAADLRAWERNNASQLAEMLERLGTLRPLETARGLIRLVRGHELDSLWGDPDPEELGRQITHLLQSATPNETR